MADFGFWEILTILLVALLIAGPERLPGLAAELGKWAGNIRRLAGEFKSELTQELEHKEITQQIKPLADDIAAGKKEIEETVGKVNKNLRGVEPLAEALQKQIEESKRYTPTDLSADLIETSEPASTEDRDTREDRQDKQS